MTLVRKLIIVLVGVSLAVLMTVLLLDPDSISRLAFNMGATSALVRVPLAVLLDVIVLAVIVVLVRGQQPAHTSTGLMVNTRGAITDISVESARDRLLRAVRAVPDVASAEAAVKAVRGKADVDLDVVVARTSTNLPEKQRELDRALRQVINKELGLQMAGKPRVHIRLDSDPLALAASTPPARVEVKASPVADVPAAVNESTPAPEVPAEAPLNVEATAFPDAMSLRPESKDEPEPPASR